MSAPQITLTLPPKTGESLPEPAPVRLKMPARSPMDSEKYAALVALGVAILDRQPGEFIAGNPQVRTVLFVERSLRKAAVKMLRPEIKTQRGEHAGDMALQALFDAAGKAGRVAEIEALGEPEAVKI